MLTWIMSGIFLICTAGSLYAAVSMFWIGDTGGGFVFIFFVLFFGVMFLAAVLPRISERSERAAKLKRFVCGEQKYRSPFVPHWQMMVLIGTMVILVAAAIIVPVVVRLLK